MPHPGALGYSDRRAQESVNSVKYEVSQGAGHGGVCTQVACVEVIPANDHVNQSVTLPTTQTPGSGAQELGLGFLGTPPEWPSAQLQCSFHKWLEDK